MAEGFPNPSGVPVLPQSENLAGSLLGMPNIWWVVAHWEVIVAQQSTTQIIVQFQRDE